MRKKLNVKASLELNKVINKVNIDITKAFDNPDHFISAITGSLETCETELILAVAYSLCSDFYDTEKLDKQIKDVYSMPIDEFIKELHSLLVNIEWSELKKLQLIAKLMAFLEEEPEPEPENQADLMINQ